MGAHCVLLCPDSSEANLLPAGCLLPTWLGPSCIAAVSGDQMLSQKGLHVPKVKRLSPSSLFKVLPRIRAAVGGFPSSKKCENSVM